MEEAAPMIFPEEEKAMPSYLCELSGARCWTELSDASISMAKLPADDFFQLASCDVCQGLRTSVTTYQIFIFGAKVSSAPYASKLYFAVNEITCARGCASAHAITSCELV